MLKRVGQLVSIMLVFLLMLNLQSCKGTEEQSSPLEYVSTLVGTDSEFSLSNGNTYPAIALPWGMNFWTPMTAKFGDGWTYKYDDHKIRGFKQTHQPSPWINDYAAFALMAGTGAARFGEDERASWFSHKAETASPHYYSVYLADYDTRVEITPTERAAVFRFTFPENDSSYVLLDGFPGGSMIHILPDENKVIGYCRNNRGGVPENFHNYFVVQFDRPFTYSQAWNGTSLLTDLNEVESDHAGAILGFSTDRNETIEVKVASSFISHEQAAINLDREIGDRSFDEIKMEGSRIWNRELNKIKVSGSDQDDIKTFYSALYRTLLFPRKFYEFNAENEVVHYSPYNGEVLPGYMFTDNGFWDTFRAVFPFFTLMYPEMNSKMMQGLVNTYKESGWLPEWASPGHRACMIGSNSASIIADSYLKGIRGYDIETLYEAMVKNSGQAHPYVHSVGRLGHNYYNELGYIPYDVGINENTARTLEYAYADFCLSEVAKELDKPEEEVSLYTDRARNYRNVFDSESGWMRGRNQDGTFQAPFNPFKWGDAFTEGNSIHYTWSVFQDIEGLIELMGGNDQFVSKLDTVFSLPPVFDDSYYGFPIHEIREMQIVNMGNYAHGNQPIQHMIYLYNYARAPWKAQHRVREVMEKLYTPAPDGYCGDEDNGQTSAWYVFSALGFYPVCPGSGEYVIGSPLFERAEITLENGNTLDISAKDNSIVNVYIDQAQFKGRDLNRNFLTHEELLKGGKLEFQMSDEPNMDRGIDESARPFSMSLRQ